MPAFIPTSNLKRDMIFAAATGLLRLETHSVLAELRQLEFCRQTDAILEILILTPTSYRLMQLSIAGTQVARHLTFMAA